MPTFNKNKDSLAADINGTYEGTDPDDNVHYDDYHAYTPGEQKTDDAVYDNDDNTTDEGESAVNPDNITTKEETHTAASTLNATVMTMQAWIDAGAKPGPYWVYDVTAGRTGRRQFSPALPPVCCWTAFSLLLSRTTTGTTALT